MLCQPQIRRKKPFALVAFCCSIDIGLLCLRKEVRKDLAPIVPSGVEFRIDRQEVPRYDQSFFRQYSILPLSNECSRASERRCLSARKRGHTTRVRNTTTDKVKKLLLERQVALELGCFFCFALSFGFRRELGPLDAVHAAAWVPGRARTHPALKRHRSSTALCTEESCT